MSNSDLNRFIEAQELFYDLALEEVRSGRKINHWIWYIFPQIQGLGHSCYATFYGIKDFEEAKAYHAHNVLGVRLREITQELLKHSNKTVVEIFGELDALKVRSCMTLFDIVKPDDVFAQVLDRYYDGVRDEKTIRLLGI